MSKNRNSKQLLIEEKLALIFDLKTISFDGGKVSFSTKDAISSNALNDLMSLGTIILIKRSGDGLRILLAYDFD